MQFGLSTFGDNTVGLDGGALSSAHVLRNIVEEGALADQLQIDTFTIGEHHRDEYAVSSPDMVLASIAARTERITLGTAVTVLSSDDPIRVYERFATLDGLSKGRAEITLGRGSFTESFPLFGLNLADYEALFEEKLEIFNLARQENAVTWSGTVRAPLREQQIYPKTESGSLSTWIGVGGSPESVARAARYGLPLMLAILSGPAVGFDSFVRLHRKLTVQFGFGYVPVGIQSGGFVADTDREALDTLWEYYAPAIARIGRERGWRPPTREQFEQETLNGSIYAGSPETVARRIANAISSLGIDRFDLKYASGAMPHEYLMRSIQLYGTEVVPRIRELIANSSSSATLSTRR